ncbi:lipid asymmetry maintenance protein MlaB [uncultured Caulobacter sp.]|jgi:anti-anti-sigma regulatory factor|uniref:STAS domain-containing protein n=1 Tax=uncultured Caulobacter sp. TaxID=158749 RepID=UPI002621C2ED|nr:STAS domain-containing protein [uncultured Caulobacter sp.]
MTTVFLPEDCQLPHVAQIKDQILAAWSGGESLLIDVSRVREVDVASIQLLEAARREASQGGRSLTIRGLAESAFPAVLERGGFLDPAQSGAQAAWLSEGEVQ